MQYIYLSRFLLLCVLLLKYMSENEARMCRKILKMYFDYKSPSQVSGRVTLIEKINELGHVSLPITPPAAVYYILFLSVPFFRIK